MNDIKINIQEDAKSDWMAVVNRHKKKQKGLPALSKLNTNAGNVEHNINMFNMMQSNSDITIDPSSGNVSSGDSCCEDYAEKVSTKDKKIVFEYNNLPIEVITKHGNPSGYYSSSFGNWLPDDNETTEILIDWSYEVDIEEVMEYLQDLDKIFTLLDVDPEIDEETLSSLLEENIDFLLEKLQDELLDYFYDAAVKDAQENYKYEEPCPEYDPDDYEDSTRSVKSNKDLDDNFTMSMRTLL